MRVIGGKFKGKKLFAPENDLVRPTTDRIKETLFNILFSKGVCGETVVLDLFGGSGALPIEALSRGAKSAVIIDSSPESMRLIRKNLAHVGAAPDTYELYCTDFELAMKKLSGRTFDLIFADPPYSAGLEGRIAEGVARFGLLAPGGVLVIEHSAAKDFAARGYDTDRRICGSTALSFLSYEKEETHNE